MDVEMNKDSYHKTDDGWSMGGDISGSDFDKLTGGDWKDFN